MPENSENQESEFRQNEGRQSFQQEETSYLTEILQKTPWWALSVAFHAMVLLVLWRVNFSIGGPRRVEVEIVARLEKRLEDEYDAEKDRDIKKRKTPLKDVESSEVEAPKIETDVTEFDEHVETDDNMELSETAKGFEDAMGLEDAGSIGVIGGPSGGKGSGRYGFRSGGGKRRAVMQGGGGKDTESAVEAGLRWLARHQAPDGAWHPDTWSKECPAGDSCIGKGGGHVNDTGKNHPTAITGFALLAYLGAGHTHQTGSFRHTVKKALDYLHKAQDANGRFRPGSMYTHGIAALAAVEAYGMTRSKKYQKMAQAGIDYIVKVQNPLGGWDYNSPSERNDMSVCGWQIMALKSAKVGGLKVPDSTIRRTIRWLDIATDEATGNVCYAIKGKNPKIQYKGGGGSIRMRAAGMLCHLFFGKNRNDPVLKKSGDVFLKQLPSSWPTAVNDKGMAAGVDLYYWYYATLVNFQLGGKYWKGWNKAMKNTLVGAQVKGKIHADGSWPPVDAFSDKWSRPGITALCILSLEVYYRYLPLYAR